MNKYSTLVADALASGQVPWRFSSLFHRNIISGKPYAGVAPLILEIASNALGFSSPWWGSVADWRFARSVVVASNGVRIPNVLRPVFNWEQTDRAFQPPTLIYPDPKTVLENIVANAGIQVDYVALPRSDYEYPPADRITIPHAIIFYFSASGLEGYDFVLSHEIFHWTEVRMGWGSTYDLNELRADIGAGLTLGLLGVKPFSIDLADHHREYASSWTNSIRSDPYLLFQICNNVTKTIDYLFSFVGQAIPWHGPDLRRNLDLAHSKMKGSILQGPIT